MHVSSIFNSFGTSWYCGLTLKDLGNFSKFPLNLQGLKVMIVESFPSNITFFEK